MRLIRTWQDVQPSATGAVVAIGNFDGVHKGHRVVIQRALDEAANDGAPSALLTFEPHPRTWFQPDAPPFRLTPLRTKTRQIEALSVDLFYVLAFDQAMASRPAEAFVDEILVRGLQVRHVVVGDDFVFGKGRGGSVETLQAAADNGLFDLSIVSAVDDEAGATYSSTRIRDSLRNGNPAAAAQILGRPWEIEGHILPGDQRGRTIGFPTANMDLSDYVLPMFGVYAVEVALEDPATGYQSETWLPGVANLGERPTIGGGKILLEAHIFDFSDDIYGRLARVRLIDYIRPEVKFDGLDALQAQIADDAAAARRIIAALPAGQ